MEVTIRIDDARVRAMLTLAPGRIQIAMNRAMTDATVLLLRRMKEYPPPRPNQQYVRMNTLKRSWSREVVWRGADATGRVGSNSDMAPYNREVQDAEVQGPLFRGRWQTVQSVARDEQRTIVRMFDERIREQIGGTWNENEGL